MMTSPLKINDKTQQEIKSTCEELFQQGFMLAKKESGRLIGLPATPATHDRYLQTCTDELKSVYQLEIKTYPKIAPRIWQKNHVTKAGVFAKQHDLKPFFALSSHPYSNGLFTTDPIHHQLYLGASARIISDDIRIELDHEYGHVTDFDTLKKIFPEKAEEIKAGKISKLELINLFYKAIEKKLTSSEKNESFYQSKALLIDSISQSHPDDLLLILEEVFRSGEEILDRRFKKRELQLDEVPSFISRSRGKLIPPGTVVLPVLWFVAFIQEGNIWSEYQKRTDFNPEIAKGLHSDDIAFFRTLIRGASRYFPSP